MQVIRINKFVLGVLILTLLFIFLFTSIYLQVDFSKITLGTTSTKLLQTHKSTQELSSNQDDEFLVNTFGCKMARLPVMTPKIQGFFKPPDPIVCSPPAITESDECKK